MSDKFLSIIVISPATLKANEWSGSVFALTGLAVFCCANNCNSLSNKLVCLPNSLTKLSSIEDFVFCSCSTTSVLSVFWRLLNSQYKRTESNIAERTPIIP